MSKIVSLQILRGLAATLVAGFHLEQAALAEGFPAGVFGVFSGGEIGVDIFFVISGFIIFHVSQNRPGLTRRDFIAARFWRIFPPYWAILTLYVLAALALSAAVGDSSRVPSPQSLLISYLLLPNPDQVIIIAWTLSIEILFYVVFALTYFGGGPRRLIGAMLLWVLASQIFLHVPGEKPTWLLLPLHSAVLEFLFGILIASRFAAAPDGKMPFSLPAFLLGAVGVSVYLVSGGGHVGPFGREIAAGIPSALLVYGVLGFKTGNMDVLETWGESSYILYLFHPLYYAITGKAVALLTGVNVYGSQAAMLAMLISVVLICYAATVRLERPYQHWYRRRFFARSRSRRAGTP